MMPQQLPDAAAELLKIPMTVEQRLELIGKLWDAIPDSPETLPVLGWHQEILEERFAAADADPGTLIPWDEVERKLRAES